MLEGVDITILDGGTGSELRRRGMLLRDDVWSALAAETHYDLLRDVHRDYVAAGADMITANTFATTRFVLDAAGAGERFAALNRRTVQAALEAREASGRAVTVAASLSCLPPALDVGRYPSLAAEARAYAELAELCAAAGAERLLLEMLQDTVHAPLACAAARASGLPFWLGVSCRLAGGQLRAYDLQDVALEACLDALLPFAPDAVCIMHTPLDAVPPALDRVRARWSGPIGVYPEVPTGEHATPPEALAAAARGWLEAGATVLGGCCGTTPAHIRALAALRDSEPAR